MENGFVVNFVGDTSGLTTATETAADALSGLGQSAQQAARETSTALVNVGRVAQQAGAQVVSAHHQMTGASQQAKFAVIDLGHVVRDLPYALANPAVLTGPFDRMFQAITQLKQETGSFKGALSALAGSLSGGTGILIGFELLTTVGTFLAQSFMKGGDAAKSEADKIKDARKALTDYVDGLDSLNKARVQGAQNAQEELVKLGALYRATQDVNRPLSERKKIVDELQAQYPQYFKNISDETILNGGAEKQYQSLAEAILAAAKARAFADSITDLKKQDIALGQQQLDQTQQEYDALQSLNQVVQEVKDNRAESDRLAATGNAGAASIFNANKLVDAENSLNDARKKGNDLQRQRLSIQSQIDNLTLELDPTKLDFNPHQGLDKVKAEKPVPLMLPIKFIPFTPPDQQFRREVATEIFNYNKDWVKLFEHQLQTQPLSPRVSIAPDIHLDPNEALINAKVLEFSSKVRGMLENSMQSAFVGFGEGIGQAIAGGSLGNAFKSIAGVVGDFVESLGKELITTSTAVKAFKLALQTLFASPAAAIGVGIGLVAIGALIKSASAKKSVKGFAQGGVVSGPTLAMVGEGSGTSASNPEIVAPLDKLKNFLNPGSGNVNVSGEFRLHGYDLVAAVSRELKSQGRDYGR